MKTQLFRLFNFILVVVLLFSGSARFAIAQDDQPPTPPAPNALPPDDPHAGPRQDQNGQWYMPEEQAARMQPASQALLATGGPDDFGYTWDDNVAFTWIDASAATDTGLANNCDSMVSVPIGFSFKYYENTYSTIYVDFNGYLMLGSTNSCYWHGQTKSPSLPNNVIAPYWGHFINSANHVRYMQGGSDPNRYLVVEWYQMADAHASVSNYTFEAILYENGDILFQYQTMDYSGGNGGAGTGIEDSTGLDGFSYQYYSQIANNKAVRFNHPADSARIHIYPLYQGAFTYAGGTTVFQIPVQNTGELGSDTYDLVAASIWPTSFYAADGTTPLTDTDSDSVIDTGPVSQGGTANFIAKVQTPGGANVGDAIAATVTASSSLNTAKSKTVTLRIAIPAPFTQVYRDDYDGAMSLYLAQPGGQELMKAANNWWGYQPAVAEAPNGNFAYVWNKGHCLDDPCNIHVNEIEYTLLNKYGETVRAVSKLTNNSGATVNTYDSSPVVAVAPDGRIGILWVRWLYNNNQSNYNIFLAVLDASGNVTYGPVNLTNNSSWGDWNTADFEEFYDPKIAATGDNRFVLAWQKWYLVGGCSSNDCSINDIYYAVRDTGGNEVKGITQFTDDTTGSSWEGYYGPNLTGLTENRALITWERNSNGDIYYAVLDSAGNVIKDKTNLSGDGSFSWDRYPDAAQLSDGKVVVGWTGNSDIRFTVLDTNYNRTAFPSSLDNPVATTGNESVSVAADNAGHAILTWMDSDWSNHRNLYYALVNGNGGILTQPMIFRTSHASIPLIETSSSGYGNTSYSSPIATGVDTAIWPGSTLAGGAPGGSAPIGVNYANHGRTTATGVEMTATLGTGLTYLGDTSGSSPAIAGNLITWNLPDISFMDNRQFALYVSVPDTSNIGTRFAVALTLTANETDTNASDNVANLEVMAVLQVYLPLIRR